MKKQLLLFLLFFTGLQGLFCQITPEPVLIKTFNNGSGADEIGWSKGQFVHGVHNFSSIGKEFVITDIKNQRLVIYNLSFNSVDIISTSEIKDIDVANKIFSNNSILTVYIGGWYQYDRQKEEIVLTVPKETVRSLAKSSEFLYPIGNYIFYKNKAEMICALDSEGNNLSYDELTEVLDAMNEEALAKISVQDDLEKECLRVMQRFIDWGEYLIIGDRLHPFSANDIGWFAKDLADKVPSLLYYWNNEKAKSIAFEGNKQIPYTNIYISQDFDNEYYYLKRNQETHQMDYIQVISKYGEHVTNFSLEFFSQYENLKATADMGGNILFIYYDKEDKLYKLYKIPRTWGDPSMLSIGMNGLLGGEYDDYVKGVLSGYDASELRLQRNYLFALNDYAFKSEDLQEHFGEYDWYQADPSVTSSTEYLSDAQVKLLEYIQGLEGR